MTRRLPSTPTPVGALLAAALPSLTERLLAPAVRRAWEELVGADLARRAQPGELRMGTLIVIVDNSPWLQELRLRERELLARLQARFGGNAIRALTFTLGTLFPVNAVAGQPRASKPENEGLTDAETGWVARTTACIDDPALAETLRRLLAKDTLARRKAGARQ